MVGGARFVIYSLLSLLSCSRRASQGRTVATSRPHNLPDGSSRGHESGDHLSRRWLHRLWRHLRGALACSGAGFWPEPSPVTIPLHRASPIVCGLRGRTASRCRCCAGVQSVKRRTAQDLQSPGRRSPVRSSTTWWLPVMRCTGLTRSTAVVVIRCRQTGRARSHCRDLAHGSQATSATEGANLNGSSRRRRSLGACPAGIPSGRPATGSPGRSILAPPMGNADVLSCAASLYVVRNNNGCCFSSSPSDYRRGARRSAAAGHAVDSDRGRGRLWLSNPQFNTPRCPQRTLIATPSVRGR